MTKTTERKLYTSGVWEQYPCDQDGIGFVVRSRHTTAALARAAARRIASLLRRHWPDTGGAMTWCGGWRGPDGVVHWELGF